MQRVNQPPDWKIGERVGAISHTDQATIFFLGYGTYMGKEIPPLNINPFLNRELPNPKILLDNGKTVWGCECWWGSEQQIREIVENSKMNIVEVDIDERRRIEAPVEEK